MCVTSQELSTKIIFPRTAHYHQILFTFFSHMELLFIVIQILINIIIIGSIINTKKVKAGNLAE